jgi:hypothetical protein
MSWRRGHKVGVVRTFGGVHSKLVVSEEAKRFEDGLQEQKDFLYIQRKYVSWFPKNRSSPREKSEVFRVCGLAILQFYSSEVWDFPPTFHILKGLLY